MFMTQVNGKTVRLTINGQESSFPGGTLADLLRHRSLDERTVVAEVNGVIIAREHFSSRTLADGDVVELVRFVGGG